jgi:3-phenylpropionate/trans-cinnamate dioxygenase ferredoxin reductase subunit
VFGDEMAEIFAGLHRAHGVEFRFDAQVTSLAGDAGLGEALDADVVLLDVGAVPRIAPADPARLADPAILLATCP